MTVGRVALEPSRNQPRGHLDAARKDPLHAAFVLAIAMGLRRGEIVGLRWHRMRQKTAYETPGTVAPRS